MRIAFLAAIFGHPPHRQKLQRSSAGKVCSPADWGAVCRRTGPGPPRRGLLLWLVWGILLAPAIAHALASLGPCQQAIVARIDSLWSQGAREAAHALVRESIPTARTVVDSLFLLNLLARQGQMWAALDQTREAEPVLQEALLLADALQDPPLRCACRRWLGVVFYGQGHLEKGYAYFRELLALAQQYQDRRHEGYAWMGLGYYDWKHDNPHQARREYLQAADILQQEKDLRGESWARIGLNNVLSQLGAYAEALSGNRRIIELGHQAGMLSVEALGHNNLGVLLYSLGDPGEALAQFRQAFALQERNGNIRESIVAGRNMCLCEMTLGRTSAATSRLQQLLGVSRREGYLDQQGALLEQLGGASRQQGQLRLAIKLYREALGLRDGLDLKTECEALVGLSDALAAVDSSAAALAMLRARAGEMLALDDDLLQFQFRIELGRRLLDGGQAGEACTLLAVVEERGRKLGLRSSRLEALPLAARAALARGRPDSALALLRRAAQLWEADRGLPLDPEWREQRGAAARELFTQLVALELIHPAGHPIEQRTRKAFDALQAFKARTLLERMLGPGGREVPVLSDSSVTLAALQSRVLEPGEVLLDFLLGPEQSQLFACTRETCRVLALPAEKEFNAKLQLYHELLAARPRPGPLSPADRDLLTLAGRELSDLLFGPIADLLGQARRVILIPDGAVNLLPPAGFAFSQTDTEYPGAFLPPDLTFCRIPSATVLARLRRQRPGTGPVPSCILALAGPSVGKSEVLPGTQQEVQWLEKHFQDVRRELPGELRAGREAGNGWPDCAVLHLAQHFAANDPYPWRSAIQLPAAREAGATPADEMILHAADIAACKLPVQLVVLSGCQSAGGRILAGEGVQGLTSAFLSAGAQAVLATLWPVDDLVTAEFMQQFYRALQEGEGAAAALNRAQQAIAREPHWRHPFYWAGFVLIGEGDLLFTLSPRSRRIGLIGPVIAGGIVLVLAILTVRRRMSKRS